MVEINDDVHGTYNSQIKLKTIILKSILCDYNNTYILVNGTITITRTGADAAVQQADKRCKWVTLEKCTPFTLSISKINSRLTDNVKSLDVAIPTCT